MPNEKLKGKADKETLIRLGKKFPCILAWERYMGAYEYYILFVLDKAEKTNAPRNAIYEREGSWVTADSILRPDLRAMIEGALPATSDQKAL